MGDDRLTLAAAAGPEPRLLVSHRGGRVAPVVGTTDRLPFRGGCFHEVECDEPVRLGVDAGTAVAELARVAALDGRVRLRAPNRQHPGRLLTAVLRPRGLSTAGPAACTWGEVEELARPVLVLERFGRRGAGRGLPVVRRLTRWVVVVGTPR